MNITTKFKIYQTVYGVMDNKIHEFRIIKIAIEVEYYKTRITYVEEYWFNKTRRFRDEGSIVADRNDILNVL